MDKLKKLQMVARALRAHHGYKKNKESDSSIRFDFKFNKENGIGEPRKGGLLVTAGISKFSSMTWGLSVYGEKNDFIDDPVFFNMIRGEMSTGDHIRPREYPNFIAESYFTTSEEMKNEIAEAGFMVEKAIAIEGCIWFTPHLAEKWENKACRERLLDIVRMTESEPEMMGISPHFLIVAQK